MLAVPASVFAELPPGVRCSGSPLAVGASVTISDAPGPTIRSIAEIRNRSGTLVGWVYLASTGSNDDEFAQASGTMSPGDLRTLHLKRDDRDPSTIAPLAAPFAPRELHVVPCSMAEQKITDR
jgi:hypothetical protein